MKNLTLGISFVLLGLKQMKCMALGSYSRRLSDSYFMNSRESEIKGEWSFNNLYIAIYSERNIPEIQITSL